jgi:hypothetical protein
MLPRGNRIEQEELDCRSQYPAVGQNQQKELLELIDDIRSRVGRELKRPAEFISCCKAGYDGFWLHRLLEENGARCRFAQRSRKYRTRYSCREACKSLSRTIRF